MSQFLTTKCWLEQCSKEMRALQVHMMCYRGDAASKSSGPRDQFHVSRNVECGSIQCDILCQENLLYLCSVLLSMAYHELPRRGRATSPAYSVLPFSKSRSFGGAHTHRSGQNLARRIHPPLSPFRHSSQRDFIQRSLSSLTTTLTLIAKVTMSVYGKKQYWDERYSL